MRVGIYVMPYRQTALTFPSHERGAYQAPTHARRSMPACTLRRHYRATTGSAAGFGDRNAVARARYSFAYCFPGWDDAPLHRRLRVALFDRKSFVSGQRVSVRVDLGGSTIIKKKT